MIRDLLGRDEGKTLEFKENARSLGPIIKTVVAVADTAGGALVIGVRDRTKEVVGVRDVLAEEERLASAVADSIRPQLLVDIQLQSWQDREVLILTVPHSIGPHHVRTEGPVQGVYVRLGSTNRRAGPEVIAEIRRLARNVAFDEQPCPEVSSEAIDFRAASELFSELGRPRRDSGNRHRADRPLQKVHPAQGRDTHARARTVSPPPPPLNASSRSPSVTHHSSLRTQHLPGRRRPPLDSSNPRLLESHPLRLTPPAAGLSSY